ncbi:MAG: hypothetical protein K1X85_03785 [Ignavibacteria bacterium]|nr:hypothetical protein [Ignavibacteria bacterium]
MLDKKELISAMETLPENPSLEEVLGKIILLEKINQGLDDVLNDRTYTHEQVMEMVKRWSKSDGRKEQ